jgi:3-deoxy-D-manno-octulosonic-acid transferase
MIQAIGLLAYILGTRSYFALLHLAARFNNKAKRAVAGRKNWKHDLQNKVLTLNTERIWFHCASLGEYEQAKPVMEMIRAQKPEVSIVVSFFSPSGYDIRKNDPLPDLVCYLPFDTAYNARTFLRIIKPSKAVFVKYEFWHFFLRELNRRNIPVYLIAAHFRADQIFFRWYGTFYRTLLKRFHTIFCQFESDRQLLSHIRIPSFSHTGDTRYDRVIETVKSIQPISAVSVFKQDSALLVLGSSYAQEEKITADWLRTFNEQVKIVVAPHEIEEQRLQEIERTFQPYGCVRYSGITETFSGRVLIIDNVGMLSRIYQYADMAFIGGGFGTKGLHNILEALAFGCPVVFGPNHKKKFPESLMAEEKGVASTVTNAEELNSAWRTFISINSNSSGKNAKAIAFIQSHSGISERIYSYLYHK